MTWLQLDVHVRLTPDATYQGQPVFTRNSFTRMRPHPPADAVGVVVSVNTVDYEIQSVGIDFGDDLGSWVVDVACVIPDTPNLQDPEEVERWLTA